MNFNPHEREARDAETASVIWNNCPILIHTSVKLVTHRGGRAQQRTDILIHTSVKLVTSARDAAVGAKNILIHTSVKLVTHSPIAPWSLIAILIHTSVKLVTDRGGAKSPRRSYFNPHEREARDEIC